MNHSDELLAKQKEMNNWFMTEQIYKPLPSIYTPQIKQGIICKAEDDIFKHSKIGVSFRLGGLQYVNQLERQ